MNLLYYIYLIIYISFL